MKQELIILSRKASSLNRGDAFSGPAFEFFQPSFQPATDLEFNLQVESMDKKEIAEVIADPNVSGIAPSMPTKLIAPFESKSEHFSDSEVAWGVEAVQATDSPFTGKGIKVAVLDTGIDRYHEAFAGVNLVEQNFTNESPDDLNGHGTHVAGTIFGRDVEGIRIGVAKGVETALIGKVLGNGGGGTKDIYQAISWASREGATVISMSLGIDFPGFVKFLIEQHGFPPDLATSRALEGYRANVNLYSQLSALLRAQGGIMSSSLLVAAAGNESKRDIHPDYEIAVAPPAASNGVLSVGALMQDRQGLKIADFSNTGVRISAPGVGIQSARVGGGLVSFDGTSMATPHVAGVFALWAEKLKSEGRLNHRELNARVEGTATWKPIAGGQDPADIGSGLVQAPSL